MSGHDRRGAVGDGTVPSAPRSRRIPEPPDPFVASGLEATCSARTIRTIRTPPPAVAAGVMGLFEHYRRLCRRQGLPLTISLLPDRRNRVVVMNFSHDGMNSVSHLTVDHETGEGTLVNAQWGPSMAVRVVAEIRATAGGSRITWDTQAAGLPPNYAQMSRETLDLIARHAHASLRTAHHGPAGHALGD